MADYLSIAGGALTEQPIGIIQQRASVAEEDTMPRPDPIAEHLRRQIKRLATLHGLNDKELAARAGLTHAWVNKFLRGQGPRPQFSQVEALLRALGTTLTEALEAAPVPTRELPPLKAAQRPDILELVTLLERFDRDGKVTQRIRGLLETLLPLRRSRANTRKP